MKLFAFLLFMLAASVALGQEGGQVEVKYLGAKSYYAFTRVVFDTGGERPEGFKINYDPIQRQVVLYPASGTLSLSFAPVMPASDIVREVSFTEGGGPTGIVINLSPLAALGYRVSYLSEPGRIALDFYDKGKSRDAGFLPIVRPVRTVAIDPGHGGRSFGSSKMEGMPEKELDMDVALRLRKALTARGFKVVMTREGDAELSPVDRAGAANAAKADVFISIHASGSYGRKGMGPAFYTLDAGDLNEGKTKVPLVWAEQNAPYLPDSLRLARALIADMGAAKGQQPALHEARLSGFDGLAMPAVMAELGDLDDPDQAQKLSDDSYRDKIAAKMAHGIEDFARGVVH
jgi:N-acetylmuramoyl-L-alanine amidase